MNQKNHMVLVVILNLKLQYQGLIYDYAYAYILVKGAITNTGAGDDDAAKQLD